MGGIPIEAILFWVIVGAILGAIINDQKGRSPATGAVVGGVLGLIGVLLLAIQSNLKNLPSTSSLPSFPAAIHSAVYRSATRQGAEASYHADARMAAASGYVPISEDWSSALGQQVLTVTYRHDPGEVPRVLQALATAAPGGAAPPSPPSAYPPHWGGPPSAVAPEPRHGVAVKAVIVVLAALAGISVIYIVSNQQLAALRPFVGPTLSVGQRGTISFGQTFNPQTFALTGQSTTFPSGSSVAMVAVFTGAPSTDAQLWITQPDGASANLGPITGSAGNDVYGVVLAPYYFAVGPGRYSFAVKDVGGNTLASGSVSIT